LPTWAFAAAETDIVRVVVCYPAPSPHSELKLLHPRSQFHSRLLSVSLLSDLSLYVLSLAYAKQGQTLLEGFNFFKIQNANVMPDRVPLFGLQLADKQQLVSFLRDRGIDIAD
jgi:hypothetical protein